MRKLSGIFLWLCFLFLSAPAHAKLCPSPESLKAHGVPEGFEFVPNNTKPGQHSKVYAFDTALLDQNSAMIDEGEGIAESNALNCQYDASIVLPNGNMPFYIIRPLAPAGMKLRVKLADGDWGGFCWEPEEQQTGCVVVCHNNVAACPFEFAPEVD